MKSGEIAEYTNACDMSILSTFDSTCLNFRYLYDTQKSCSNCGLVYERDLEKLFMYENNVSMFDTVSL